MHNLRLGSKPWEGIAAMSVTLELTELETDYVTQALQHELDMTEIILRHPEAVAPEVIDAQTIKWALIDGIVRRLVEP